ncbi:MAG: hypothetical protein M1820_006321 [Bogoriella megaspora]|nr:MAG: hypothetical protein M1820_006321 [Bogoriella megaspora]
MILRHYSCGAHLQSRFLWRALQCRQFSTTNANARATGRMTDLMPKGKPSKSARTQRHEAMTKHGNVLEEMTEFGLMQDTFIMPTGSALPSFLHSPTLRLRLEKARLKQKFLDRFAAIAYKFQLGRPRPRLRLRGIPSLAQRLHSEMYTAFASGDTTTLNRICCSTLASSFTSRIASRPPRTRVTWTLHRYLGAPRVVSHKCAKLPTEKIAPGMKAGIRQVVVRIRSRQEVETWRRVRGREVRVDGDGKEIREGKEGRGEEEGEEVTEYVVVQQKFLDGVEGEWMVWGTTEEMTVEEALGEQVVGEGREKAA